MPTTSITDGSMAELRFRHFVNSPNGPVEYTLYPEKTYEDGWVIGWCPELERTMAVHPSNIIEEENDG